jgi:hypothetical protein
VSVHIESFCPFAAFFKLTASKSSFMGCLNRGRELIIPFNRLDFSPILSGVSASSYESATLLKAGSSIDSSLGVHLGGLKCQSAVHIIKIRKLPAHTGFDLSLLLGPGDLSASCEVSGVFLRSSQ